jgi:transposase
MLALSIFSEYLSMQKLLNEKQWRQYLALEAKKRGNITKVAHEAGVSRNTVKKGLREIATEGLYQPGDRVRKKGAGVKSLKDTDKTLVSDLEGILEPKGDPQTHLQWTTKSLANLVEHLSSMGHSIRKSALANMLHKMGFSLKSNKKNIEGTSHPDRNLQFEHINKICTRFEQKGLPIISIDCKKKELIGNFKNNGREWLPQGKNESVNVYDYTSLADGKAVPYGIYDVVYNNGFINVGIDHDTAEFAVESIRRWWRHIGKRLYPKARELLITADGGGSNGTRNRLWKYELQKLADETYLTITICHFPPATSKWNKIEHRLFSFISINWRAKPLISLETVIELINHTTTKEGLKVTAVKDSNHYPTGIKITDEDLARLNIQRNDFHGEWNYTISPQNG